MRVTNASTYRNFTTAVNNVHLKLNKSMDKISSGEQYENAAANPLAYYEGKVIDNQYLDTINKKNLLKDVQNRIYQQELGIRNIQTRLSEAKNNVQYANTATTTDTALDTTKSALLQKMHEMVNSLNTQYQNFYVYGGNDVSTPPFSLSADGSTLTYSHTFPGESNATVFKMELKEDSNNPGSYKYELLSGNDPSGNPLGTEKQLVEAMSEQGRIDIGYGTISDRQTLLDTYTGGMNVLTGITSDAILTTWNGTKDPQGKGVMDYLSEGPLALVGRSVQAIGKYLDDVNGGGNADKAAMSKVLSQTITDMSVSEHSLSSFYSDLGNKYRLIDNLDERLGDLKISLETQYKDKLGADPYASIMEMYNNNYAYNAALQVGSKLMSSSLFDFMA
ncbi:MAG: flagellar hook-basal body protein [Hungatella sp.]|nr:flagellar hook-basal body protein [Hungatella sp.]